MFRTELQINEKRLAGGQWLFTLLLTVLSPALRAQTATEAASPPTDPGGGLGPAIVTKGLTKI